MLVVNGDQQVHLGHFATFSRLSNQIIPAHPQDRIAKPLRDLLKGLSGKDQLHTSGRLNPLRCLNEACADISRR
jgi:hypothetical protein